MHRTIKQLRSEADLQGTCNPLAYCLPCGLLLPPTFVAPCAVLPFSPGSVSTTSRIICFGRATSITFPSKKVAYGVSVQGGRGGGGGVYNSNQTVRQRNGGFESIERVRVPLPSHVRSFVRKRRASLASSSFDPVAGYHDNATTKNRATHAPNQNSRCGTVP